MTHQHSKLADARYIPGASPHDDDMSDAEWHDAMGDPTGPALEYRSFDVVYYPDSEEPPFTGNVLVAAADVSQDADGRLTEYLIGEGMAHEWQYADAGSMDRDVNPPADAEPRT